MTGEANGDVCCTCDVDDSTSGVDVQRTVCDRGMTRGSGRQAPDSPGGRSAVCLSVPILGYQH